MTVNLTAFDSPDVKPSTYEATGLDQIPDGFYTLKVLTAEIKEVTSKEKAGRPSQTKTVVSKKLEIKGGSYADKTVNWDSWLTSNAAVGVLMADLKRLGFDTPNWNQPGGIRPFSQELPKALRQMVNMVFEAKKETNPNPQNVAQPFHNLRIGKIIVPASGTTTGAAPAQQAAAIQATNADAPWG